jgi:hypothetical protein
MSPLISYTPGGNIANIHASVGTWRWWQGRLHASLQVIPSTTFCNLSLVSFLSCFLCLLPLNLQNSLFFTFPLVLFTGCLACILGYGCVCAFCRHLLHLCQISIGGEEDRLRIVYKWLRGGQCTAANGESGDGEKACNAPLLPWGAFISHSCCRLLAT